MHNFVNIIKGSLGFPLKKQRRFWQKVTQEIIYICMMGVVTGVEVMGRMIHKARSIMLWWKGLKDDTSLIWLHPTRREMEVKVGEHFFNGNMGHEFNTVYYNPIISDYILRTYQHSPKSERELLKQCQTSMPTLT